MNFSEQLNNYIKKFECSSQDLVNSSGLSSAVISRYRNGERTPNIRSKQLENLADGLYKISFNIKCEMLFLVANLKNNKNSRYKD